jgi:hypothetical protein
MGNLVTRDSSAATSPLSLRTRVAGAPSTSAYGLPQAGRLKGRPLVPDGRRLVATRGDSGSTHLCTRLQRSFTGVRMLAGLERA